MVFKRVLKGIGRLMLTTAVMCGVGLFLCSSEVKAAVGVELTAGTGENQGGFIVTFTADSNDKVSEITEIQLLNNSDVLYTMTVNQSYDANTDINNNYTISPSDFIKSSAVIAKDFNSGGKAEITNAKVLYTANSSSNEKDSTGSSVYSKEIYKISIPSIKESGGVNSAPYNTDATDTTSEFVIKVGDRTYTAGNPGYGYAGESVEITPSGNSDYYINYYTGSTAPTWDSGEFLEPGATYSVDSLGGDVSVNVQYFPKLSDLWYSSTGGTSLYLDSNGKGSVPNIPLVLMNSNGELSPNDRSVILSNMKIAPCSLLQDGNGTNIKKYDYVTGADGKLTLNFGDASNHGLLSVDSPGSAIIKATALKVADPATQGPINQVTTSSSSNYVNYTVYAHPTGISILKNGSAVTSDKINVSASNEYTLKVLPGGADQTINYATGITTSGSSHSAVSIDASNKKIKITGSTAGSDTITVTAPVKTGESTTISKSTNLAVTVVALDKDKTVSKINDSNENYITVGDYKLDVASLVSKYATDGTNHIDGITPKAIKITSGSDYAEVVDSTKIKGKKEGTVELSIFLNTTDTSTTPDLTGVKIGVYPKPTATYSSSNRTLTVKMPTKVSTGYGEEKNIRKTTGFKLLLEDSSGNSLYEYTDSKYQKVLSSSSDKTVSYTVTASDIEGMVTSAASNGKFSSDTTSVKFKVIPMGYKQSNSEDETIKAKDEIAGTTDAVTVYKVSASGTNFSSTAAYGLDGQTVSLTATPNSGYTFKQWSDGNTSNPRQIKVSASGTRSFQAVAGERVANSTGGTDNSALYDDVPKTAESNSAIWLIVFMVFAVMGTTYALYLQLRAANSKHDR